MKYLAVLLMAAAATVALLLPAPATEEYDDPPASVDPPVAVCPLIQSASRSTEVSVLSSISGSGSLSAFAAGEVTGVADFRTGATGSVVIPVSDAGAVGFAGGLLEMPSDSTAAGVTMRGSGSLASEACAAIPTGEAFLTGGSTAGDAVFQLILLNPYAGDAVVDLTVTTDAGIESDQRFDDVIVPALSTITLDFSDIIGGREEISVDIETLSGAVLAFGREVVDGRSAVWRAVEPAQDWWIPAPAGGGTKQLRIGSPNAADVEYQIDLYGPDGFVEEHASGVIAPRGRARIPMAAVTPDALAMRVISTAPVVPTLWIDSDLALAATAGSPVDAPLWLLPGASLPPGGSASIVILNSGLDVVSVAVRPLGESSLVRNFDVDPEEVLVVNIIEADGYRVEATGPVVAMWASSLGGAGSAAMGIPIQDE